MQVKDTLPGVGPLVDDEAISGRSQPELFSDPPRCDDHPAEKHRVGLYGSVYAIDVLFRNDERVHRRDGSDVAERNEVLVLEEDLRRSLASRDVAK